MRMDLIPTVLLMVATALAGCVSSGKKTDESAGLSEPSSRKSSRRLPKRPKSQPVGENLGREAHCLAFKNQISQFPYFVESQKFLIARLDPECQDSNGVRGSSARSRWVALDFPCTGGGGKVEIAGHAYAPKQVKFHFSLSCPTAHQSYEELSSVAQRELSLHPNAQLMAILPMQVQFWELPDSGETDVGNTVMFRDPARMKAVWDRFQAQQQIPIVLYGRESSWGAQSGALVRVEGFVQSTQSRVFQFFAKNAQALSARDIQELEEKCEALEPKRRCAEIF